MFKPSAGWNTEKTGSVSSTKPVAKRGGNPCLGWFAAAASRLAESKKSIVAPLESTARSIATPRRDRRANPARRATPPHHGKAQVSANRQQYDLRLELPPLKKTRTRRRGSIEPAYQITPPKLQHFPISDLLQIGARSTPRAAYATV